jgi:adapter protein MecA 1/2
VDEKACCFKRKGVIDMKIERINDHQIRCTLTSADLTDHQIKLSELAFGTEKAKRFFRDMMEQASSECGFDADNIPLMIEAIPASPDSITLIITKVDSPDALSSVHSSPLAQQLSREYSESMLPGLEEYDENARHTPFDIIRIFNFQSLDDVILASHMLKSIYTGSNSLYKDTETQDYLLLLTKGDQDTAEFFKICNMLSEYGVSNPAAGSTLAFLEEHCKLLLGSNAVQKLAEF